MKQNPQPFIQVYVLCHNRTQFVKEAVTSVLKQSYLNFEVIVSDNSSTNEVFEELNTGDELNKFRYIRRPNLSLAEHQNEILAEVTAPFFMMFHDDDVLQKNALQRLVTGFENDHTVAVGANGFIMNNSDLTTKLFNPGLLADKIFNSAEELAAQLFDSAKGEVPFSVYLFKTEAAKKNIFSFKEGNTYVGAAFLLKLSTVGPVVWLADALVNYRKHSGNAPVGIDVRALFSFYRLIRSNLKASESLVTEFKMKQLSLWSLQRRRQHNEISKLRKAVIIKASLVFLLKNPVAVYKAIMRRIRKLKNA